MGTCSLGIDIGGTNLRFALVDETGAIRARIRLSSAIEQGREAFCGRLCDGISAMRSEADSAGLRLTGSGAGVPGLVTRSGVVRSSVNMRPLDGFDLTGYLQLQTGLPAACDNDANVIALGEQRYGAGRGLNSCVVVTIGTGLGSGLILDGRIWNGVHGFAAEFGHVTVEPQGFPCPCGNRGCLEQYVSAGAVVRSARELLPASLLEDMGNSLDAAGVARLAGQGEPGALAAFDRAGRRLGYALAGLVNTLDLEAAIIGGGVGASLDLLLPGLREEFNQRCFPEMAEGFSFIAGALGDDAGLLGGAALVDSLSGT